MSKIKVTLIFSLLLFIQSIFGLPVSSKGKEEGSLNKTAERNGYDIVSFVNPIAVIESESIEGNLEKFKNTAKENIEIYCQGTKGEVSISKPLRQYEVDISETEKIVYVVVEVEYACEKFSVNE